MNNDVVHDEVELSLIGDSTYSGSGLQIIETLVALPAAPAAVAIDIATSDNETAKQQLLMSRSSVTATPSSTTQTNNNDGNCENPEQLSWNQVSAMLVGAAIVYGLGGALAIGALGALIGACFVTCHAHCLRWCIATNLVGVERDAAHVLSNLRSVSIDHHEGGDCGASWCCQWCCACCCNTDCWAMPSTNVLDSDAYIKGNYDLTTAGLSADEARRYLYTTVGYNCGCGNCCSLKPLPWYDTSPCCTDQVYACCCCTATVSKVIWVVATVFAAVGCAIGCALFWMRRRSRNPVSQEAQHPPNSPRNAAEGEI